MRIEATMEEAKPILEALRTARNYLTEVKIQATKKGLYIREMDISRVNMVAVDIPRECFLEWKVEEEGERAIDLELGYAILPRIRAKDAIRLEATNDTLKTTLERGINRETCYTTRFILPRKGEYKEPEIPPDAEFYIDTKQLKDILKKVIATDNQDVTIIARPSDKSIYFTNQFGGKKHRKIEVKLSQDTIIEAGTSKARPVLKDVNIPKGAMSTYLVEYLLKAVENAKGYVKITYATNAPMRIESQPEEGVRITVYTAPKVEE